MMTDQEYGAFVENQALLRRFAERWRGDAAVRERIAGGDASDLDVEVSGELEIRVVEQSPEVYYLPMPANPNAEVSDQMLEAITGGSGTASSAGTNSTASSLPSCLLSASTIGTLGSATGG